MGEDDDGSPAVLHTVEDLVRDALPGQPVSRVETTLELRIVIILRSLQSWQQLMLNIVGVLVRVGDEDIVELVLVNPVLREEVFAPGC